MDDLDFDPRVADLFASCCNLENLGKIQTRSHISLSHIPSFETNDDLSELPFRITLTMNIYLLPSIMEPIKVSNRFDVSAESQRRVLQHIFPSPETEHPAAVDIPFFYSSLSPAPAIQPAIDHAVQPPLLRPTLLPFQRRSTLRLLALEGKTIDASGQVHDLPQHEYLRPGLWETVQKPTSTSSDASVSGSGSGDVWYFNRVTGALTDKLPTGSVPLGGLLAEEMGLGKTLECLALILLNPSPNRNPTAKKYNSIIDLEIKEVKTTLIVTPQSLAEQWLDEIKRHTPHLKVFVYPGWSRLEVPITEEDAMLQREKLKRKEIRTRVRSHSRGESDKENDMILDEIDSSVMDWATYVNQFDIVITNFTILQQDLSVARAPMARPRREAAMNRYNEGQRPRSPLIMVEWARAIMDEVQLVGTGKAAEMMSLIPRRSSLAVSGTPAKTNVADLANVLKFLKINDAIATPRHWQRLLKPGFSDVFTRLFQRISIRTLKAKVQDELTIPTQRRFVVGIEMGKVERHVYNEHLRQALAELGLNHDGKPLFEGWQVDVGLLRTWIRKLRALATHPQVGQLLGRDRIGYDGGNLKSISQVLDSMREESWRALMDDRKNMLQLSIRHAQLIQSDENNHQRYQNALALLLECQAGASQLLHDLDSASQEHRRAGFILRREALRQHKGIETEDNGTAMEESQDVDVDMESSDIEDEENSLPKTIAGQEHSAKTLSLQLRYREAQVVQHRIYFLLGDVYHVLGSTVAETEAYEKAEEVRRSILKVSEVTAVKAMERLRTDVAGSKAVSEKDTTIEPCGVGGIKSTMLLDEADDIIDLMKQQADLLFEWRTKIFDFLTKELTGRETNEADGEEYGRALEIQGEVEQYLQAYFTLLGDRKEALVAERTILDQLGTRETKQRTTKAAMRAAAEDDFQALEDDVPEDAAKKKELNAQRKQIRSKFQARAIKSVMIDLNKLAVTLEDKHPEKQIALREASRLKKVIADQNTVMDRMESELALFRKAFNDRIVYFRQLQEISDSVAEVLWEGTLDAAVQECLAALDKCRTDKTAKVQKLKFLESLASDAEEDQCIICTDTYQSGWIFDCAHRCCNSCLAEYLKKGHKLCPVCRVPIDLNRAQKVVHSRLLEPESHERNMDDSADEEIQYNTLPLRQLREIDEIETSGSFGSKIQSIVRHLVWLKEREPEAKSIVFSAWADSLAIIQHALKLNGISSLRVEQKRNKQSAATKFKTDPDISVFLLHGERENAGLNLIEAARIFCIEPVVNHAFEMQAIARIDRMGQDRDTEVFCYYSEDTVEKNILDLGVKQGMSLYTKDRATGTLVNVEEEGSLVSQKAVDAPIKGKKQKGDFVHSADDMMSILLPRIKESAADNEVEASQDRTGNESVESEVTQEMKRKLRAEAAEARRYTDAGPSTEIRNDL
ncbi:hypothetical protein SISNIDRAFT_408473 [Sistotremastrum niveocremeum HHB9708]|uniref:RING-type domain-containing protein n=1 Tax=Sistotremastrum niveocremeum HHB9708 TaxID=1314777 RepID=A0A164WUR9_9AGAM|nr:hypothetical protein SISNIDRAFT_408473 [Sistotremastrum niveocremeum HHB9708]